MKRPPIPRREFLRRTVYTSAGLLVPASALGCDGDPELDAGIDAGRREDAGAVPLARKITKGPYVQLTGPGSARLRFETRFDEPVPVVIDRAAGREEPVASRAPMILEYRRDAIGREEYMPDAPGLHVLHEVRLEGLGPGERVSWTVTAPEGGPKTGSFTAPVEPGMGFSVGWISDTSFPIAEGPIGRLAERDPMLVLHGGDITYMANPFDTWNGMMAGMAPLMQRAPVHFAVGNHEFEDQMEVDVQFDRLFGGQGEASGSDRFFAFTYGAVRFLVIDTESGALETMDATQLAWLDAELAAASADPDIAYPIAMFHRPTYTLSKHAPGNTTVRDLLHTKLMEHRVPLVLAGHSHSYERFEVDGIQYVIDGGGGAVLYDPNEDRDEVERVRPGESALRQAVDMSHGVTALDVRADGSISLSRIAAADGRPVDEIVIAAPA